MNASTVILISLLTSAVVSFGTVYTVERLELVPRKEKEAPQTTVPTLRGLSEDDARANLAAGGLVMLVQGREASSDVGPGQVLKHAPPVGTKLARGEAVTVTIAQALPKVSSVTGLTPDGAATVLGQAGFRMKTGEGVVAPEVPEGKIASQAPAADTGLAKDSEIVVRVSIAPKPVEAPNVLGMGFAAAKEKIQGAGLRVGKVGWLDYSDRQANIVMQQDPAAGKKAKLGDEVNLSVNR